LGLVTSYTLGGFIHILLVIALIVIINRVVHTIERQLCRWLLLTLNRMITKPALV